MQYFDVSRLKSVKKDKIRSVFKKFRKKIANFYFEIFTTRRMRILELRLTLLRDNSDDRVEQSTSSALSRSSDGIFFTVYVAAGLLTSTFLTPSALPRRRPA